MSETTPETPVDPAAPAPAADETPIEQAVADAADPDDEAAWEHEAQLEAPDAGLHGNADY